MRAVLMIVGCLVVSTLGVYVVSASTRPLKAIEREEPKAPGVAITIHSLTPNLRTLSVRGYRFDVSSSQAVALHGVKQIEQRETANSMVISISNTTDRTFLIEHASLSSLVTVGTRFVDDDGNEWQIRLLPLRFIDTEPVYSIPSVAGESTQIVLGIGLTSFIPLKEGLAVPTRLHYEVLQPASLKSLEVIGDQAKPMADAPMIWGKGVFPVDEEGIR